MEALTMRIDSQFKEIKGDMIEMRDGCNKCGGPHLSSDCDDKPMEGPKEEEANYASGGYRGNYYGQNYGNWQDRQSHYRDENRNSNPSEENTPIPRLPEKKPDESGGELEKNHERIRSAIQDLETKFGRISDHQSSRPTGTLPSNTQTNLKPSTSNDKPYRPPPTGNELVNAVFTHSGKTYDPPVNPNIKPDVFLDDGEDEVNEVEKEAEPLPKKPTHADPSSLKAYKPKILYPQRLHKEKMEARYAKFLDMINEVRINVPFVDVLASMPNYGKYLKDFVIENLCFPVDLLVLEMEEDDRVPLILGSLFLHTADAIIRVKNKELNLVIKEDRATFLINKGMQHSHLNDDTCFRMDVINEVTEDELDALLDDSKPFSITFRKDKRAPLGHRILKSIHDMKCSRDKSKDDFEELPPKDELRIKTSIQGPPTDLEMKPLPKHLEYAFLEENSLLPVVISAYLFEQNEKQLVSVLKNHKEAFAWKTSDIPGISPSFCKHKINFEDDVKPVIQRQRRLNPNMKEVVKKEIIKLLDAGIIYAIKDNPWVSPLHYVLKKRGMTVVTNKDNELVPTRIVTGWRVCIDYRKLNEAILKDQFPVYPHRSNGWEGNSRKQFLLFS
ncbi:hypothetical protein Tco_0086326 [Tanacetum coccineum]